MKIPDDHKLFESDFKYFYFMGHQFEGVRALKRALRLRAFT